MPLQVTSSRLDGRVYKNMDPREYADILKIQPGSKWFALYRPAAVAAANPRDPNNWSMADQTDMLRIPMFPYLTTSADPSTALAFAVQLGFQVRDSLGDAAVSTLHISFADPVEEILKDGIAVAFSFHMGIAVEVLP